MRGQVVANSLAHCPKAAEMQQDAATTALAVHGHGVICLVIVHVFLTYMYTYTRGVSVLGIAPERSRHVWQYAF
jgi:hypothetical protein